MGRRREQQLPRRRLDGRGRQVLLHERELDGERLVDVGERRGEPDRGPVRLDQPLAAVLDDPLVARPSRTVSSRAARPGPVAKSRPRTAVRITFAVCNTSCSSPNRSACSDRQSSSMWASAVLPTWRATVNRTAVQHSAYRLSCSRMPVRDETLEPAQLEPVGPATPRLELGAVRPDRGVMRRRHQTRPHRIRRHLEQLVEPRHIEPVDRQPGLVDRQDRRRHHHRHRRHRSPAGPPDPADTAHTTAPAHNTPTRCDA